MQKSTRKQSCRSRVRARRACNACTERVLHRRALSCGFLRFAAVVLFDVDGTFDSLDYTPRA